MPRGGHFAPANEADLLADVAAFFGSCDQDGAAAWQSRCTFALNPRCTDGSQRIHCRALTSSRQESVY
jgi:hypothetical protein